LTKVILGPLLIKDMAGSIMPPSAPIVHG